MEESENRYADLWNRYRHHLKVDYFCSLSDFCKQNHVYYAGMSTWVGRQGYKVSELKEEIAKECYGGETPLRKSFIMSSGFRAIVPSGQLSVREPVSLLGVSITFNSGTTITIKQGTATGVVQLIQAYEGKEGNSCIL